MLLVEADTNNYLANSEAVFSYIVISILPVTPEDEFSYVPVVIIKHIVIGQS
jgi:hypothetical protein